MWTSGRSAAVNTATTPGASRAALVSRLASRACATGLRTIRAKTCSGRSTSSTNEPAPVSRSRSSTRRTAMPTNRPGVVSGRSGVVEGNRAPLSIPSRAPAARVPTGFPASRAGKSAAGSPTVGPHGRSVATLTPSHTTARCSAASEHRILALSDSRGRAAFECRVSWPMTSDQRLDVRGRHASRLRCSVVPCQRIGWNTMTRPHTRPHTISPQAAVQSQAEPVAPTRGTYVRISFGLVALMDEGRAPRRAGPVRKWARRPLCGPRHVGSSPCAGPPQSWPARSAPSCHPPEERSDRGTGVESHDRCFQSCARAVSWAVLTSAAATT